jgi:phosphoesterase RecJ-like protein
MKLFSDGRIAVFDIPQILLEETGATMDECKRIVDEALEMRSVQAALMIAEHPHGGVKLSLRTDGSVNAATVMSAFGGGGHRTRSGGHYTQKDDELINNIITMITKELV